MKTTMIKITVFSVLQSSFLFTSIKAQNIGVNSTGVNAHPSALLDIDASPANATGFLMPRMTNVQRKAIATPAAGLQVYDITLKGFYVYDGGKWDCVTAPAGTFDYFCNTVAPNGYLICNGQAVSRTTYAELFAAIGTLYGVGDGSTTFNVPELRGEFIRGVDNARGIDAGRVLGSGQVDDFKSHKHTFVPQTWGGATVVPNGVSGNASGTDGDLDGSGVVTGYDKSSVPLVLNNTGGTETRPRNVALLPCIKF